MSKFLEDRRLSELDYPIGLVMKSTVNKVKIMADMFNSIEEYKNRNVHILCQGSSGAIMASLFSEHINNESNVLSVKKDGENSHSGNPTINPTIYKDYVTVIIDDFISSGSTLNRIYGMFKDLHIDTVCVTGYACADQLLFEPDYFICYSE